ncbi:MAG: sigma-70 family RNA polymerase sigma factor [Acidobacteriia bacterium]|nr:sigma-70 family RNA polymerase sigma factor [Terriglobia bacterium]
MKKPGFPGNLSWAQQCCYVFAAAIAGLGCRCGKYAGQVEKDGRQSAAVQASYLRKEELLSSAELQGVSTDVTLVSAIRSGDESAMGVLYDRYSSIVYSVALRVLGDTGAAEDVMQEVFMQLWRNPGLFDSSRGNLGAWLAVIARNRAIDALRKRHPQTDIEGVVLSVEQDMAGAAERARAMEKVRTILAAMPAAQRIALEMAYFEGLTHTEIAAKTGEPLGTIKTRIRAGLLALRKAFSG